MTINAIASFFGFLNGFLLGLMVDFSENFFLIFYSPVFSYNFTIIVNLTILLSISIKNNFTKIFFLINELSNSISSEKWNQFKFNQLVKSKILSIFDFLANALKQKFLYVFISNFRFFCLFLKLKIEN